MSLPHNVKNPSRDFLRSNSDSMKEIRKISRGYLGGYLYDIQTMVPIHLGVLIP